MVMLIGMSSFNLQGESLNHFLICYLSYIWYFYSNLPPKQQEKLLKKIDKDGDGKITLDEFRQLFEKQK